MANIKTGRKQAEQALKVSEEKFSRAFHSNPHPMSIVTMAEGRYLDVNDSYVQTFGFPREELLGRTTVETGILKDNNARSKILQLQKEEQALKNLEVELYTRSGQKIEALLSADKMEIGGQTCLLTVITDVTERKRMEETLRKSEERLAQLYDEAPVGYHELDSKGRIVQVNRTELDMLGYTAKEMLGKYVWDFMVEVQMEISRQAFAAKVAGNMLPGQSFERTYRRKDGTTFPVLIEDRYVKDESGQIIGLRSTIQDITERKRAEETLRKSEERLAQLYDEAPVGYHELDSKGRIVQVNRTELDMLGYTAKEMLGKHVWDFMVETDTSRQAFAAKVAGNMLPGQSFERTYRRKDGTTVTILIEDRYVKDDSGKVIGLRSTMQNITERKKMEQEMRESEAKLSAIVNSAGANIHMLDKDCNILWTNQASKNMYGEDIVGRKCYEAFHQRKEPCQPFPCPTFQVMQDGKTHEWENQAINEDGQKIYVSIVSSVALRDEEGNPWAVVEVNRDITDSKKAEEALKESEERYRALVNLGANIGEAVVMLQDDERGVGMFSFVNEEWTHITGYSEEELLNISMADLIHPGDRKAAMERHGKRMRGEELPGLFELSIIRKDGIEVPVEVTFACSSYKGKPANVGYIRDITERKQAEEKRTQLIQELQETLKEIRTLSGLLPICAWCKKLRDDEGYWKSVEQYIGERTKAQFTHGICPECNEKFQAEENRKLNSDTKMNQS